MVAKYCGLQLEVVSIKMGVDNKAPDYLAKFPMGKVPGFVGADGYILSESSAVCYYLIANATKECPLVSKDPKVMAQILKWVYTSESDVLYALYTVVLPNVGILPKLDPSDKKSLTTFKNTMDGIENSIKNSKTKFLATDSISLGDVSMFSMLTFFYKFFITEEFVKKYPNIDKWYKAVLAEPNVSSVYKEGYQLSTNKIPDEICAVLFA